MCAGLFRRTPQTMEFDMKKLTLLIALALGFGSASAFAYDYQRENHYGYTEERGDRLVGLAYQSSQSHARARALATEPLSRGLAITPGSRPHFG
jgi:hypothetical protein